jgi:predicted DsbA family dithiol-disulfide isomerase
VRLVIKHYPYRYRDYSYLAAQAAEAARVQGKFWEYFDLMMYEKRLTRDDLIGYARQLNLDVELFTSELDSETHLPRVEADVQLARKLDFYQTPIFVINGRTLTGDRPIKRFRKLIDAALAETAKGD